MNGGILPLSLIGASVGLALTFANGRIAWTAFTLFAAVAICAAILPLPSGLDQPIFVGLLLSSIATGASAFIPGGLPPGWAIAAALNGGAWLGAAAAVSDMRSLFVLALPLGLLFVPGKLLAGRNYGIAIKVFSSWLIAVATLSLFVSLVPTPGYEPDHME